MKKIILTMMTITTIVLMTACNQGVFQNSNENKKGSGKLTVSINENIMRTILPTFGTVSQYDISGTGPDGKSFTLSNTGTTKEIADLIVGSWTITVTGKDASNNAIVSGTATATVVENQSTPVGVTVNYRQLGKGSVNLTINWDVSVTVDSVMLQIDSGTATNIYTSGNSVNYTNATINSGFYKFIFKLKNGGNVISSVTESVHIYDFHNTTKTIDLAPTDFNSKPTAPTGLSASEGTGKIVLNWTDTSKVETGFVVERSATAGSGFVAIGGTDTTPLAANTITYNDTTAVEGTTYYYRVLAKNSFGSSAYSNEGSGKVEPPVPGNSGTLTLNGVTATGITVNWTKATDNVTSQSNLQYLVYRSTSNNLGSVANCEANGTKVDDFAANITTKTVTGLNSGTTYYFNVVVKDEVGNKTCYGVNSATTLIPVTFNSAVQSGGTSSTADSTGLTLTFSVDPTTLAASDITVTGATKGVLSGTGTTRSLVISAITVGNGETVSVAIASPSGFSISGSPKTAVVYKDTLTPISYRDLVSITGGIYTQTDGTYSFGHAISNFLLGQYEVTYELWYTVYQWAISNGYQFANAGREGRDGTIGAAPVTRLEPVTTVNWRDVIVWCNKASEREGLTPVYYTDAGFTTPLRDSRDGSYGSSINTTAGSFDNPYVNWNANGYRLPTEAEWEYAASRKSDGSRESGKKCSGYYGTDEFTGSNYQIVSWEDYIWYGYNSGGFTKNVGTKTANSLGIHDMSGNVWEWCWDWHGSYTTSSPYTDSNSKGATSGSYRVFRGASCESLANICQVGSRINLDPFNERNCNGFRLVRKQ